MTFECPAACPLAEERVVHDNFGIFTQSVNSLLLLSGIVQISRGLRSAIPLKRPYSKIRLPRRHLTIFVNSALSDAVAYKYWRPDRCSRANEFPFVGFLLKVPDRIIPLQNNPITIYVYFGGLTSLSHYSAHALSVEGLAYLVPRWTNHLLQRRPP